MFKVIEENYDWTGDTWTYDGFETFESAWNFIEDIQKLSREDTEFTIVRL